MNFVPARNEKLFFRYENNGVMMLQSPNVGVKFLNSTSALAFENVDGVNSFEDIVNVFKETYPEVDEAILKKDILDCLYSLRTMKIIKWKGEDEQMNETKTEFSIEIAGEQDYGNLSKYIYKFFPKIVENNSTVSIPVENKLYYRDISIRTRQFNFSEMHFFTRRFDEITSLLSILGFSSPSQTVALGLILANNDKLEDLISNYNYVEAIMKNNGKIKIKANILENRKNEAITNFLEKVDFRKEALLEKEFNNIDLHMYCKLI